MFQMFSISDINDFMFNPFQSSRLFHTGAGQRAESLYGIGPRVGHCLICISLLFMVVLESPKCPMSSKTVRPSFLSLPLIVVLDTP